MHFDKLKFKAELVKVNWDGFCLTSNPNDTLVHFLKIVNKLLDKLLYIKLSNIQKLDLKLSHGSPLEWPVL